MEWKRRLQIIGITLGVYLGFRYVLLAALPFLLAWLIAGSLYPCVRFLEKKLRIRKTFTGAVILGLILLVVLSLVYIGIRELIFQGKTALEGIPMFMKWGSELLSVCCLRLEEFCGIEAAVSEKFILTQTGKWQTEIISVLGTKTAACAAACMKYMAYLFSGIFMTYILSVMILGDMENLQRKIREIRWMTGIRRILKRLGETVLLYLKAQFMIMILVSVICALGFWFLKSPYFLLFGILIGFFDMLPVIGTGTLLYPGALIFFLQGNRISALVCILLDIGTSILRKFLEPMLLGEKLGFSPILILASVYGGVFLYGVSGVILGPLSFSTFYEIGRESDFWE